MAKPDEIINIKLTTASWHHRFLQQAVWSEEARRYIFNHISLPDGGYILETGCGSGVITSSLQQSFPGRTIIGIDHQLDRVKFAKTYDQLSSYTNADGFKLPFASSSFDLCTCHFFLMWLNDPSKAIVEMVRVTRHGGYVAALAEPDYGGRIDFPFELSKIGQLQTVSLKQQGADPYTGRKLARLFKHAGLLDVQVHLIGGRWQNAPSKQDIETEWSMLHADLEPLISHEQLQKYQQIDRAAWLNGERILFVPTFFAWGKVPLKGQNG